MANPQVRPHLHFLPEDAGERLSEAWHGNRWLCELDPDLASPMVRSRGQDFYVLEPVQLTNGQICMRERYFTRGINMLARAWPMRPSNDGLGWIVVKDEPMDVMVQDFLTSYPKLRATYQYHQLPDPSNIIGGRTWYNRG